MKNIIYKKQIDAVFEMPSFTEEEDKVFDIFMEALYKKCNAKGMTLETFLGSFDPPALAYIVARYSGMLCNHRDWMKK
jgi:hypothetical protein